MSSSNSDVHSDKNNFVKVNSSEGLQNCEFLALIQVKNSGHFYGIFLTKPYC